MFMCSIYDHCYKEVITLWVSFWLLGCPIITQEPLDQFVSNVIGENSKTNMHFNVLSLDQKF